MEKISASKLLAGLVPADFIREEVQVELVTTDSREVRPGCIFVAFPGEKFDGHDFAAKALENGAVYVVVNHPVEGVPAEKAILYPEQINGTVLKLFCNSSGSAQGAGIIHFDFNPAVGALINQVCKFLAAQSGREIRGLVFAEPKNHIRGFLHSLCSRDCRIPARSCCSTIRRGRVSTGNSAQRQGKSQDQCQNFFHGRLFLLLFCRFCSAACSVLSCYHGRSILSTTEFSEKYNYFVL
jgi:hypothetical protein